MSQRFLDEREHRRGLVLGLTLAEILILLLFLLLLALGSMLEKKSPGEAKPSPLSPLGQCTQERDQCKEDRGRQQGAAEQGAKENEALRDENKKLKSELDKFGPFIKAATMIDPNGPPAARLIMENLAKGLTVEDKNTISAMSPGDKIIVTILKGGKEPRPSKTGDGEHDWPPIITLSDASGYFFRAGSAELSPQFRVKLTTGVLDQILKTIEKYKVDVIEVIGHTDEQPVYSRPPEPPAPPPAETTDIFGFPIPQPEPRAPRYPNLDATLIPYLNGQAPLEHMLPFDNAGLGLARAAAVVRLLLADERLREYRILPLSAGQLIQSGDVLSPGSPGYARHRRRIEIRMRRSDQAAPLR